MSKDNVTRLPPKPVLPTTRADRGYIYMDAGERIKWHLKVIADCDAYWAKHPKAPVA